MTAPVGLFGVFTMSPRVAGVAARATSAAVRRKRAPAGMGTNTDRAPASVTISGKDTQYGTGTRTSSPSSKSARQAVCSACLPPAVTTTSAAVYGASHAAR